MAWLGIRVFPFDLQPYTYDFLPLTRSITDLIDLVCVDGFLWQDVSLTKTNCMKHMSVNHSFLGPTIIELFS